MSKQSEILRQQLKSLQSEADRILDQIDQKEAEILRLENDEDLNNLAHQRREILEELRSTCKLFGKKYRVNDENEDIVYLRETKSGKNLAALVYDDHTFEELEEWVQTQIESTQFYDTLVSIAGVANLISAQVDSPVGIVFNESNHAELIFDVDTDRVTISHYRELSMKETRDLLNKSFTEKNVTVEYIVSDDSEDEDSIFYVKTVTIEELPDLVGALKNIKESIDA